MEHITIGQLMPNCEITDQYKRKNKQNEDMSYSNCSHFLLCLKESRSDSPSFKWPPVYTTQKQSAIQLISCILARKRTLGWTKAGLLGCGILSPRKRSDAQNCIELIPRKKLPIYNIQVQWFFFHSTVHIVSHIRSTDSWNNRSQDFHGSFTHCLGVNKCLALLSESDAYRTQRTQKCLCKGAFSFCILGVQAYRLAGEKKVRPLCPC